MCGTGGVIGSGNSVYQGLKILTKLQNRGQDAAGYGTLDTSGIEHVLRAEQTENSNPIKELCVPENLSQLIGPVGVFGTRYRTMGGLGIRNVQPYVAHSKNDHYTLICSQNGNIKNCERLRKEIEKKGFFFKSDNDTEVITKTLAYYLGNQKENDTIKNITDACAKTMDSLVGGYTVVFALYDHSLKNHYLVAFTDPRKIRPGVVGKKDGFYAAASESSVLELNGFRGVRDLLPGEVFTVNGKDMQTHSKVLRTKQRKHCFFEYVYFGSPNSVMEGLEINDARFQMGWTLAQENMDLRENSDIVMPHPYTAIPAAAGFAEKIGLPVRQGIYKDRYAPERIFIKPEEGQRTQAADENIEIIVSVVNSKNVIVVDDSLVRGSQSKRLLRKLEKAGAKSATLAIGCPPVISTCDKGIYIPTLTELAAYQKNAGKIEESLQKGINIPVKLRYLSLDGLLAVLMNGDKKQLVPRVQDGHFDKSILEKERSRENFCLSCITNNDPITNDTGGLVE